MDYNGLGGYDMPAGTMAPHSLALQYLKKLYHGAGYGMQAVANVANSAYGNGAANAAPAPAPAPQVSQPQVNQMLHNSGISNPTPPAGGAGNGLLYPNTVDPAQLQKLSGGVPTGNTTNDGLKYPNLFNPSSFGGLSGGFMTPQAPAQSPKPTLAGIDDPAMIQQQAGVANTAAGGGAGVPLPRPNPLTAQAAAPAPDATNYYHGPGSMDFGAGDGPSGNTYGQNFGGNDLVKKFMGLLMHK